LRGKAILAPALLSLLLTASAARADEIRLKDGTKIIGTIVGFENDSFRVETTYGFALIRKDKVADINITATKTDSKPKSTAPSEPASAATPPVDPAVVKEPISPGNGSSATSALTLMHPPVGPGPAIAGPAKT